MKGLAGRFVVVVALVAALGALAAPAPAPAAAFRITTGGVDNDLRAGLGTLVWERGADFVRYVDNAAREYVTILPSTDVVSSAQVGTELYFATQHDLYITDGTSTADLVTMFPTYFGQTMVGLRELNGQLLFGALTANEGWEPWTSSGSAFPVGTSLVKDIWTGPNYGDYYPSDRAVLNGYAFFNGDDGTGGGNEELWATNGTALGTTMVKDIRDPGESSPHRFIACGSYVYFSADDGVHGYELWRTDGTGAGTSLAADIYPDANGSGILEMACVGSRLFVWASNTPSGSDELWAYDPLANPAARLLKGSWNCSLVPYSCGPQTNTFRAVGGLLMFAAGDNAGVELWKSDGTPEGTVVVKDIWPGLDYSTGSPFPFSSRPDDMEVKDGRLYFRASHPDFGGEVWVSDGTAAGTWPVTDVIAGPGDSWPDELTSAGRLLFFRVTGDDSYNVWAFDPANTPPYRDLVVDGSFESGPTSTRWARLNLNATQDVRVCNTRSLEACSFRIVGSAAAAKAMRQVVPRSGDAGHAGELIALSGWSSSRNAAAAGGLYSLELVITYQDGTTAKQSAVFSRGTHAWQYRRVQLKAGKPWTRATVYARYQNLAGTAWFDDIRLTAR